MMAMEETPMEKSGNDKAFEEILRDTEKIVRGYIAGLGVPLDDVDDVAVEVFIEFHKGMDKIPPDATPVRWIKGIAKNLCMGYFRRRHKNRAREMVVLGELLADAEIKAGTDHDDLSGANDTLNECMGRLPTLQRKLVLLRHVEGFNASRIAEDMNMTAGAVRASLARVLSSLKGCLQSKMREEAVNGQ
ncbi:MAG: hypothetical protein C0404_12615 [Verrucomicrobia bacterium]|nr:hypothetical protein [Verrucomicrobiota bacterium]